MAGNKLFTFGPTFLILTTPTSILSPQTSTGGVNGGTSSQYIIIRHIRIVNKTASAATFTLYKGLIAGSVSGTEVVGVGYSVAANSAFDWYGQMRFDTTPIVAAAEYLSGFASVTAALIITGEGEVGVAG